MTGASGDDNKNRNEDEEYDFTLAKTFGDNSYEVYGKTIGSVIRLKVVRECQGSGHKPERSLQTIVFPLEILRMVFSEVFDKSTVRKRSKKSARYLSYVDQARAFLSEHHRIIDRLCESSESAKREIKRSVRKMPEPDNIPVAVIRTLAVLFSVSKAR